LRLIGILDTDLVAAFTVLERGLAAARGAAVLVDVRGLQIIGDAGIEALAAAIVCARAQGRDVRLDARNFPWRRAVKAHLAGQPPVDPELRSAVRRTVILAHSGRRRKG
jgi:ABC-type transporter Mla MlaB component